jgi:hypothetical protein
MQPETAYSKEYSNFSIDYFYKEFHKVTTGDNGQHVRSYFESFPKLKFGNFEVEGSINYTRWDEIKTVG